MTAELISAIGFMVIVVLMVIMEILLYSLSEKLEDMYSLIGKVKLQMQHTEDTLYDELVDIEYRIGETKEAVKAVELAITRACEVADENALRTQELLEVRE